MTSDMTTNRAVHVAAFKSTFFAAIGHPHTVWYDRGDGYADCSVSPIEPTVVHFRAPIAGGPVEVEAFPADNAWRDTGMNIGAFEFAGYVGMEEYGDVATYAVQRSGYDGVLGVPASLF